MSAAERQPPAHAVIVTPEAWGVTRENGGISTSVVHFSRLLRGRGDRVTLLVGVAKEPQLDAAWGELYDRDGVGLVTAVAMQGGAPAPGRHGLEFPFRRISEAIADAVPPDADVVYFQDWSALGFEYLRRRGSGGGDLAPPAVTILRGSSKWVREVAERQPEDREAETRLDFAERFAIERSDFVAAPTTAYRDYLESEGARLPGDGRTRLLGHPWFPDRPSSDAPLHAEDFRRLVLFGRLETLKGFDLFVDAVRLLHERNAEVLAGLEEIVFLGREGHHRQPSLDSVAAEIASFGVDAVFSPDLDSWCALDYLSQCAADSLVVIPSLRENFCNAAIEASLVSGLNLICSDVGGIPEALGMKTRDQLFAPRPDALADALAHWLARGPRPANELVSYDWETANSRWLAFHEEVLELLRRGSRTPRAPSARLRGLQPVPNGLSIVISTFEWPEALDAVLRALSEQSDDRFDVAVTDDGSSSDTADVVGGWLDVFGERLVHVWQRDDGSRVAPARNRAALAMRSEYLVFMDGDCVPRRHFVRAVRGSIRPGWFVAGRRLQLSRTLTHRVLAGDAPVHRWPLPRWLPGAAAHDISGLRALTPRDRRKVGRPGHPEFEPEDRAYGFLIGVLRSDFELVDGFDTRYVGWGEEDVDLAIRLRRLGLRCGHAGPQTTVLHLWHESRNDGSHANWSLLQETEQSERIEAVEGLRALVRGVEPQLSANCVAASSSSSEPVKL